MTVKQFLSCRQGKEELITIDGGIGPCSVKIWSTYDGWYANSFAKLVTGFIQIIDQTQEVNPEFIDCALNDKLSVLESVSSWFVGTSVSVNVMHHAEGESGLIDVSIEGVSSVRRAVFDMAIQNGEHFNVYYGDSSKGSASWHLDLISSLRAYFASNQAA